MSSHFYMLLLLTVAFQIFSKPVMTSGADRVDESAFGNLKPIVDRFVFEEEQVILLTDKKDSSIDVARYIQMTYIPYVVFTLPIAQNQAEVMSGVIDTMKKFTTMVSSMCVIVVCELNMITSLLNLVDREGSLCSPQVYWIIITKHEDEISHLKPFLGKDIQATVVIVPSTGQHQIKAFRFIYNSTDGKFNSVIDTHNRSCTKFFPRKSMEGRKISIALERHFPFFLPLTKNTKSYEGVDIELLEMLKKYLNFRYTVVRPKDGKWGSLNGGTWNGMIGMVQRQEADAALGGMSLTWLRSTAVAFTTPYVYDRVTFIGRRPKEISRALVVLRPFTTYAWLSIILALISISVIFGTFQKFARRFLPKRSYKKRGKTKKLKTITYNDSFWFVFRSLLMKEFYNPNDTPSKFLVVAWFSCVVTVAGSYQGLLTSFMAYPGYEEAVDTVAELVSAIESGKLSCGTIKDSSDHNIFKTGDSDSFRIILENMESDESNFVRSDLQGLDLATRKDYVYIAGEVTVDADIKQPELYLFAEESFQHFGYSIALDKRMWYREAFNLAILRIIEAGIVNKRLSYYIERNRARSIQEDDNNRKMMLTDLQGAFFLHAIGIIVSCLAFAYEKVYYKFKNLRKVGEE